MKAAAIVFFLENAGSMASRWNLRQRAMTTDMAGATASDAVLPEQQPEPVLDVMMACVDAPTVLERDHNDHNQKSTKITTKIKSSAVHFFGGQRCCAGACCKQQFTSVPVVGLVRLCVSLFSEQEATVP